MPPDGEARSRSEVAGPTGDQLDFVVVLPPLFSADECDRLIGHIGAVGQARGTIGAKDGRGAIVDLDVRRVHQTRLRRSAETQWIYDRLMSVVEPCNAAHFQFDVHEFEDLSIVDYQEGDFYDWHLDLGRGAERRKLSVSVMLSAPEEYDGGALTFPGAVLGGLAKGSAVVFASFLLHGVQPVTKGRRIALVGWLAGPPFR